MSVLQHNREHCQEGTDCKICYPGGTEFERPPQPVFEYIGFKYSVASDGTMTPLEGQHPAAAKEKHRRAAREEYLAHLEAGRNPLT